MFYTAESIKYYFNDNVNPPYATSAYLYPVKTSEIRKFYDFVSGTRRDHWHKMG